MGSCSKCTSTCSGSCFESCSEFCAYGCGTDCSGCCTETCVADCYGYCASGCSASCGRSCSVHCREYCQSACSNNCGFCCSGLCLDTCIETCSDGCQMNCTGTCSGDCNNACTAANEIAIINAIGDNLIQNHIIRAEDFIELKQGVEDELTRRGKGDKISHYSNNVASGNKILLEHITLLVNDLNDLVGSTSNFITDTPLASKMTQIAELIKTAKLQNIK